MFITVTIILIVICVLSGLAIGIDVVESIENGKKFKISFDHAYYIIAIIVCVVVLFFIKK